MNVREILKHYGITPMKELGQSFLISEKIANRIVEACEIGPQDVLLEVGPGLGILTQSLCKRARKVFAVEKDTILFEFLTQKFHDTMNLTLLNKDILSQKLGVAPLSTKFKLVSNLPYSITSDFLYWLLNNRKYIKSCVLTLQREVAQRIMASPGTKVYGALSVLFQLWMEVRPLFSISCPSFFPSPKVTSEVISIKPKRKLQKINEELLLKVVKTSFAKRRKQLKNSLGFKIDTLGGIDLSRRPESLGYKDFLQLTIALSHRMTQKNKFKI